MSRGCTSVWTDLAVNPESDRVRPNKLTVISLSLSVSDNPNTERNILSGIVMAAFLRGWKTSLYVLLVTSITAGLAEGFLYSLVESRNIVGCVRTSPVESDASMADSLTFRDLGLSTAALRAVKSHPDWTAPTLVQQLVIPKLLEDIGSPRKRSIWCEAPTGSGKTAAYGLPLLQNTQTACFREPNALIQGGISSIIILPTRELAVQVGVVLSELAQNMSRGEFNIMVLYGGTPLQSQVDRMDEYARSGKTIHAVVATPGRFLDVIARVEHPTLLDNLRYLVLDEADKLMGNGFAKELDGVLNLLPRKVPTWLFSATFSKGMVPQVANLMKRLEIVEPPLRIACANSDRRAPDETASLQKRLKRFAQGEEMELVGPASTIDLRTIRLHQRDRTQVLRSLLEANKEWDRVLVFVATRYACEHVSRKLRRLGIPSSDLHGKQDQDIRSQQLESFRRGHTRVLLATDLASRGLDVTGLSAVVNYDLPRSSADFIHRVGRTGRAGCKGVAVTFLTADSEAHLNLIESRHLTEPVAREIYPGFEVDEKQWRNESIVSQTMAPGSNSSSKGIAHDRMFGGVKGRRKSKKDKLREKAAQEES
jgi:ATP-dependent RNA helicase RhlE